MAWARPGTTAYAAPAEEREALSLTLVARDEKLSTLLAAVRGELAPLRIHLLPRHSPNFTLEKAIDSCPEAPYLARVRSAPYTASTMHRAPLEYTTEADGEADGVEVSVFGGGGA